MWTNEQNRKYLRQRHKQLAPRRAHYSAILARHKRIRGCSVCSEREPDKLLYHHPGQYIYGCVAHLVSWDYPWLKIREETALCIVLCLVCHAKLHNLDKVRNDRGQWEVPEGLVVPEEES